MQALDAYRAQVLYNTWFNAKLYATCADLADEERRGELGVTDLLMMLREKAT